jgi:hypothetical protein
MTDSEPAVSRDSRLHYTDSGALVLFFCLVWTVEILTAVCFALVR